MGCNHLLNKGYLDTALNNKNTMCSTPRITANVGLFTFRSVPHIWTFGDPSNITLYVNLFAVSTSFV